MLSVNILEISNLTKTYNLFKSVELSNVSFSLKKGECLCLVGESGSGKTTLLRLIAGLSEANYGKISLCGQDLLGIAAPQRAIGYAFQTFNLYPHLGIDENLRYSLNLLGYDKDEIQSRVTTIETLFSLKPYLRKKPHELSVSERQLCSLARVLCQKQQLYLFDEPFSALNGTLKVRVRAILRDYLKSTEACSIVVTSCIEDALYLGDSIGFLSKILTSHAASASSDNRVSSLYGPFKKQELFSIKPNLVMAKALYKNGPYLHLDLVKVEDSKVFMTCRKALNSESYVDLFSNLRACTDPEDNRALKDDATAGPLSSYHEVLDPALQNKAKVSSPKVERNALINPTADTMFEHTPFDSGDKILSSAAEYFALEQDFFEDGALENVKNITMVSREHESIWYHSLERVHDNGGELFFSGKVTAVTPLHCGFLVELKEAQGQDFSFWCVTAPPSVNNRIYVVCKKENLWFFDEKGTLLNRLY